MHRIHPLQVDPCSGAKLKSILATVLAGAAIIMGLLAIPLTGGASTALVFGGLAVGGVSFVLSCDAVSCHVIRCHSMRNKQNVDD